MDKGRGKKTAGGTGKARPVTRKTTTGGKKKMASSKTKTGTKRGFGAAKKTTVGSKKTKVGTKKSLVGIKKSSISNIKDVAGGKRSSKVDKFMGEMLDKKLNIQNRLKFKTTFMSLTSRQKVELDRKVKESPGKQRIMLKKILKEIT